MAVEASNQVVYLALETASMADGSRSADREPSLTPVKGVG